MIRKIEVIYLIIVVVILFYANFFTNSFKFEPIYSLYSDVAELYPIYNLFDSTLFKNDLVIINLRNHLNVITKIKVFIHDGIYLTLLHYFSLSLAIKIISIILCAFSTLLIYRIGVYLYSNGSPVVLSGLFLIYFLTSDTFYGGQDRSFGAFIFCIFLLFLVKEKLIYLPFILPLSIFFYQSFFVVLSVICILVLFFYKKNIKFKRRYILFLIINILICLFFMFEEGIQRMFLSNLSLLKSYKYFDKNNIVNPLNPLHILLYFILNFNEHGRLYVYFTQIFIVASLFIIVFRRTKAFSLPLPIWLILIGSVFSFLITYPINPVLASKQFVFSLPLFFIFFVSTNISGIIIRHKINPVILLAPIIFGFVLLQPQFNIILDYKKYKPMYDYIGSLPKDILIAGNPGSQIVDKIPFFSKRAIFFADDLDDLSYITFGKDEFWKRRQNLIQALYANSPEEVKTFVTMYNVDYFIIETFRYDDSFFNYLGRSVRTYDLQTRSLIKNKIDKNKFFLLEFVKKNYNYMLKDKNGDIFIISSKKIIQK